MGRRHSLARCMHFCAKVYLSPKVQVDWWALGTLLYEMLSGLPPFYDREVLPMS